ncbi:MAG: class I SAM-dependent methyltransferase [Gammaproteobacteria bacterium]|nr:class I SAM-dependent methyltransferase [Gammaproteobacteria bacterium]
MAARKEDIGAGIGPGTMADRADRHELYEEAVQDVEQECEFITDTFRELRGRDALSFREDFCGTASAACEWVRQNSRRTAIGVDIDPQVLEWGRQHRVGRLNSEQQQRVKLVEGDVLSARTQPVDVVGAFNFSYYVFKDRTRLRKYFAAARDALGPDGLFILDAFGGHEAFEEMKEKTKYDNFTYIWDQAEYYPITGEYVCHIHFKFPDGSKMKQAFSYEWRLWTLPEIRELLSEAGFRKVTVYWEGTDEDGEGNGEFEPEEKGEADAGWIVYIVAQP